MALFGGIPRTSNSLKKRTGLFAMNDPMQEDVMNSYADSTPTNLEGDDYSYGVEKPKTNHPWWKTLINAIGGGVLGAAGGEGAIPGAMVGLFADQAMKHGEKEQVNDLFNTERKFRQNEREIDATLGLRRNQADLADAYRREGLDLRREEIGKKDESRDTQELQDYTKSTDPSRASLSRLENLEKMFGFDLDTYDENTGTAIDSEGKKIKVDIPGASVLGMGRVYNPLDDDAMGTKAGIADLLKEDIHEFAGSAQTKQEMERIQNAFAQGQFNTESQVISGLKRYKQLRTKALQEMEASYRPELIDKYRSRGGSSFQDYAPKTAHNEAIEWARQNPNDPRSKEILKRNGL